MKHTILLLLAASMAFAQQRGTMEVKGSLGITSFADEHPENHLQTGGSVRVYLTPHLSIEPEFQALFDVFHHDIILIPNLNWDFRTGKRVVPYLTGGLGWMHSYSGFALPIGGTFSFTSNQAFAQFGAGTKIYFTRNWYIAPEFRVGSELSARANLAVGYRFR